MIKLTYQAEDAPHTVEFVIAEDHVTWVELLPVFKQFLLGIGYLLPDRVDLAMVTEDEPRVGLDDDSTTKETLYDE